VLVPEEDDLVALSMSEVAPGYTDPAPETVRAFELDAAENESRVAPTPSPNPKPEPVAPPPPPEPTPERVVTLASPGNVSVPSDPQPPAPAGSGDIRGLAYTTVVTDPDAQALALREQLVRGRTELAKNRAAGRSPGQRRPAPSRIYAQRGPSAAERLEASAAELQRRLARGELSQAEALRALTLLQKEALRTESYAPIVENDFVSPLQQPLSTFGIDVDTASYSVVRRHLEEGRMPPRDAVRIEELVNYFPYDYGEPSYGDPIAIDVEVAECPWNPEHRLARIGLEAVGSGERRKPANLVFLLDVSGSMKDANKLPLLKSAMGLLVRRLGADDNVAIVAYSGDAWVAMPTTSGDDHALILDAIADLGAAGNTNAGAGIDLAYETARASFIRRGINRVILATDGDFNEGITQSGDLVRLIRESAGRGIFLTVLGFGSGNYQDSTLETLADRGNGNYAYIDSFSEARKVLLEQVGGTLETVAKDVKVQVEFNPAEVGAYRLIGYENRVMQKQDFRDDRKDGGEMGAGQTVTALYEIKLPGSEDAQDPGDPLRYQSPSTPSEEAGSGELMTVKVRYKQPDARRSEEIREVAFGGDRSIRSASDDFRFQSAVAAFGLLLRDSAFKGEATYDQVIDLAVDASVDDEGGYRSAFQDLAWKARELAPPE
jgi:Ca-activated chloride channel family protein